MKEKTKKVNIIIALLQIINLVVLFIGNKFDIALRDFFAVTLLGFLFYYIVFVFLLKKWIENVCWYILLLNIFILVTVLYYHCTKKYDRISNEYTIFGLTLAYYVSFYKLTKNNKEKKDAEYENNIYLIRFYAFLIDFCISAVLFIIPYGIFVTNNFLLKDSIELQSQIYLRALLCSIFSTIYLLFRDCLSKGSIGKQILKLEILTEEGNKVVSIKQRVIRNLPLLLIIVEIVYFLINKKRLGDKLAHTMVGKKKKLY